MTTTYTRTALQGPPVMVTALSSLAAAGASTDWVCLAATDLIVQTTCAWPLGSSVPSISVQRSDTDPAVGANPVHAVGVDSISGEGPNTVVYYREPGRAWWRATLISLGGVTSAVSVSIAGRSGLPN